MSASETTDSLTSMVRGFMQGLRRHAMAEAPDEDPADRIIAAAAVMIAALVFAWPRNKALPRVLAVAMSIAGRLWRRREWFLP